jgi:hypothetical protein
MVESGSTKLEKLRTLLLEKDLAAYIVFHNDAHSVRFFNETIVISLE